MSFNVVSLVMQHLGPEIVARIARALGLESHLASRAIGALVPGILASLAQGAASPVGAAHLAGVLDSIDPASLGAMAGNIGGPSQATMIGSGNALVGLALGGQASDGLAAAFSRFSGLDGLSANALTGIVGTSVLGSLAAVKRSQGLDATGLAAALAGQSGNIQAAMPAGFNIVAAGMASGDRPMAGARGAESNARAAVQAAGTMAARGSAPPPAASRGWLLLLPLGAIVIGGVWYLENSIQNSRRLIVEQQRIAIEKAAAEAKAKADAEARAKAEAEAKARAAAEVRAKAEAEAKARAEAEARAKAAAEAKARADAEARAKAEADAKARADAEARQKAEADAAAAATAAKAKAEADEKQRAETEAMTAKQRAEADAKAKADADALAARQRAEADAATAKARADAEAAATAAKARADADAAAAAAAKARADAQTAAAAAKARADADAAAAAAKARADAEAAAAATKARADAEAAAAAKARADAEAKQRTAAAAPPATPPVAAAPPATVAVAKACEADIKQLIAAGSIRFRIASATIQPDSAATLNRIAAAINSCQGTKVRVEGHTDSDGDEQDNLQLSDRRAKAVQDYLIRAGVPADRLSSVGLGQSKPLAANDTAENKLQNRRTEIVVDPK